MWHSKEDGIGHRLYIRIPFMVQVQVRAMRQASRPRPQLGGLQMCDVRREALSFLEGLQMHLLR
jgi:hypothetical protein